MASSAKIDYRLTGVTDLAKEQNLHCVSSTEYAIRCNEVYGLSTDKLEQRLKMLKRRQRELTH